MKAILVVNICFHLVFAILYSYLGYEFILDIIVSTYHLEAFEQSIRLKYFTVDRFFLIKYFLYFSLPLNITLSYLIVRKMSSIKRYARDIWHGGICFLGLIKKEFLSWTKVEWIVFAAFFLVLIVFRLYVLLGYPLHVDEAYSFVYYVRYGPAIIASLYSAPNNHIFFLLICHLFSLILEDPFWIMRITALLIGLLLTITFFVYLKKHFGFFSAFLATVLFSFSAPINYYAISGRGYILLLLLFLLALYSSNKIYSSNNIFYKCLFVISCAFGFYTIPTFLYPYVGIAIWQLLLVKPDFHAYKKYILVHMAVVLCTGMMYVPVFVVSGINAIVGNSWVQAMAFKDFLLNLGIYAREAWLFFWLDNIYSALSVLIVLATGLLLLFESKASKKWVLLFFSMFFALLLLLFVQRVLPFHRVLIYLLVPQSILVAAILKSFGSKFFIKIPLVAFVVIVSMVSIWENVREIREGFPYQENMGQVISEVIKDKPNNVLVSEDTYHVFLRLASLNNVEKVNAIPLENVSYEYIILSDPRKWPGGINKAYYTKVLFNDDVEVYKIFAK